MYVSDVLHSERVHDATVQFAARQIRTRFSADFPIYRLGWHFDNDKYAHLLAICHHIQTSKHRMRVLVLGGTGGIGPLLIEELLAASHTVIIYARSPQKVPEKISSNRNVVVIKGELTDSDSLEKALEGVHAVVSALGPAVKSGPLYPSGTPIAKGYALLISLMQKSSVKRLIALGTASNKDEHDKFDLQFWVLVNGVATFAHNAYKEVVAIGETIRSSDGLIWTIARVPILTNSKSKEYSAGYIGDGKTKAWLSRVGFAAFIIDELERNEWPKKAPLVSSH